MKGIYTHDGHSYNSKGELDIKESSKATFGKLLQLAKRYSMLPVTMLLIQCIQPWCVLKGNFPLCAVYFLLWMGTEVIRNCFYFLEKLCRRRVIAKSLRGHVFLHQIHACTICNIMEDMWWNISRNTFYMIEFTDGFWQIQFKTQILINYLRMIVSCTEVFE